MSHLLALPAVLAVALGVAAPGARAQPPEPAANELALKAQAVLKKYCYRCHGIESKVEGLDVLKHETLVKGKDPFIVPNKPEDSLLFLEVDLDKMPPRTVKERPSKEEKEALKQWIAAGALAFPAQEEKRPFLTAKDVLTAIRDDLRNLDREDRPHRRYFTLAHLHNNPQASAAELRLHRAALSKAINSLSFEPEIVVPAAVDKHEAVLAVDVRRLGWSQKPGDDRPLWREVIAGYPYGMRFDESDDRALRDLDEEVFRLAGGELAHVRADWFVATATRPPLYHTLLRLPRHAGELERALGVDVGANFRDNRLKRAGFATSGVSGQNRLVERHPSRLGAYWKSYDFGPGKERGNLQKFPLGPESSGNEFNAEAFDHDGGEIIFDMPNGLHGYLLVDDKDGRIDQGPVAIVSDELKTSGTSEIVNGLSCMACHKHGMRALKDEILTGNAVGGKARLKVQKLFPERKEMDALLARDEANYLAALEKAVGPFLRVGEDKDRPLKEFPEPVGEVARGHRLADLKLAEAAFELGMDRPETLAAAIKGNRRLREIGLASLPEGGALKRADWEQVGATSLYQRVARELDLGTPWMTLK